MGRPMCTPKIEITIWSDGSITTDLFCPTCKAQNELDVPDLSSIPKSMACPDCGLQLWAPKEDSNAV